MRIYIFALLGLLSSQLWALQYECRIKLGGKVTAERPRQFRILPEVPRANFPPLASYNDKSHYHASVVELANESDLPLVGLRQFHELIEVQAKLEAMVASMRLEKDGPQPIYVAILDTEAIEAMMTQDPKRKQNVIFVSLGLLRFLQSDDELAYVLGHEMEHLTSSLDAYLNAKRMGDTLTRLESRMETAVENEMDVKSVIFRVHGSGRNPHAAVEAVARFRLLGDQVSQTHTMTSTRENTVAMAVAAISFELGQKPNSSIRTEIIELAHRLLSSSAYKKHLDAKVSALMQMDFSGIDNYLVPMFTGQPLESVDHVSPSHFVEPLLGKLDGILPFRSTPRNIVAPIEVQIQLKVREHYIQQAEKILAARKNGPPLKEDEISVLNQLLDIRWVFMNKNNTSVMRMGNNHYILEWALQSGRLMKRLKNLKAEPQQTDGVKSQIFGIERELKTLENKIAEIRGIFIEDEEVDGLIRNILDYPDEMSRQYMSLKWEFTTYLRHLGPLFTRAAELRKHIHAEFTQKGALESIRKKPTQTLSYLNSISDLPPAQKIPIFKAALEMAIKALDEGHPGMHLEVRNLITSFGIFSPWFLEDRVGAEAQLIRLIDSIAKYPDPDVNVQWKRSFLLSEFKRWYENHPEVYTENVALALVRLAITALEHLWPKSLQEQEALLREPPSPERDGKLHDLFVWHNWINDEFYSLLFFQLKLDKVCSREKILPLLIKAEALALDAYTQLFARAGAASPRETAEVFLTLSSRDYGQLTGRKLPSRAEIERAASVFDSLPFLRADSQTMVYVDALIGKYRNLPESDLTAIVGRLGFYLGHMRIERLPEGYTAERYYGLKERLALSALKDGKFVAAVQLVMSFAATEDKETGEEHRKITKSLQKKILILRFAEYWKKFATLPTRARVQKILEEFYVESAALVREYDPNLSAYAEIAKEFLSSDSDRLNLATQLIRTRKSIKPWSPLREIVGEATARNSLDLNSDLSHIPINDLIDYFVTSPIYVDDQGYKVGLASPERDNVYRHISQKIMKVPGVGSSAMMDPNLIRTILPAEDRIEFSLWQIEQRHKVEAEAKRVRQVPRFNELGQIRPIVSEINKTLNLQFATSGAVRDIVTNQLEEKLRTNFAESDFLGRGRLTADNWYQNQVLAFADLPSLLSSQSFGSQHDRLEFIEYLLGRRDQFPTYWEEQLKKTIKASNALNGFPISYFQRYIRQSFVDASIHARNFVLQELLNENTGILSEPATKEKLFDLILGKNAGNELYREPALAYLNALQASDRRVIIGHILAAMADGKSGNEIVWTLRAQGPFGAKAAQAINSQGLGTPELNAQLEDFFTDARPPTRAKRLKDAKIVFGERVNMMVIGDLRGSGSMNYVTEMFVPVTGAVNGFDSFAFRMQYDNVEGVIQVQDEKWSTAITSLKGHSNPTLQSLAHVADEVRAGAMETIKVGGVELDQSIERRLHPDVQRAYSRPAANGRSEIIVVGPRDEYQAWIAEQYQTKASAYRLVDGVSINKIANKVKRADISAQIVDVELTQLKAALFDDDGHQGNWIYNERLNHLYRIDYAKFLKSTEGMKHEVDAFFKFFRVMLKPYIDDADIRDLVQSLNYIYTTAIPARDLEAIVREIVREGDFPSMNEAHRRPFYLRQRLQEIRGSRDVVRFRVTARRALHSIGRLNKYRKFMDDQRFFEIILKHFDLSARSYVVPMAIEKLPIPQGVKSFFQRVNSYFEGE